MALTGKQVSVTTTAAELVEAGGALEGYDCTLIVGAAAITVGGSAAQAASGTGAPLAANSIVRFRLEGDSQVWATCATTSVCGVILTPWAG